MSEAEGGSGPRVARTPYLEVCTFPEGFEQFADVVFENGAERLPAHSQYLAAHSRVLQHILQDAHSFSKEQPFVLKQTDLNYNASQIKYFLLHVYTNVPIQTISDAFDLLRAADLFDSPTLTARATTYLEGVVPTHGDTKSFVPAAMQWLPEAEQFPSLSTFRSTCTDAIVDNYLLVRHQKTFSQLSAATVLHITDALHKKMSAKSSGEMPCVHSSPCPYSSYDAGNGAPHGACDSPAHRLFTKIALSFSVLLMVGVVTAIQLDPTMH